MTKRSFFSRSELTQTLWAFRREFLVVGLFSMIANLLMLSPTIYMLQIFDRVMISRSEMTLLAVSLITLFLFFVTGFAEWSRSRVLVRAGVRLDAALGTRVFNASFESNLNQSGLSAHRAFSDLTEIRQFLTGNGIFAFFDAPWTPIYIAVLFFMHPWLGIAALFFALVQAALAWFGHRKTVEPAEISAKAQSDVDQYLQSKLRNAEVVESMGMIGGLRKRWSDRHYEYLRKNNASHHVSHRITTISKFVRYCQQSFALGLGALLVIDGQLSAGGMIASNVLMTRALAPIDMMVSSWRSFTNARGAFGRLEELLQAYPERDGNLRRVDPLGWLSLRNVVASVKGREQPILKNVSLDAKPGTVTVVIGPSGSGKSTLARVMVGIWPEVAGEVLLDERPLAGWSRTEVGPHLGYLPQDIELFEGSIAENIARFSEVDSDKVIAAAQMAGLHEMILRFPNGYDTQIGEAGGMLSGGQRQRIGLARALYGEPALVVLDEPNANLDDVGEAALSKAVQDLRAKGKTICLITHRPAAIALADELVVLKDGAVHLRGPRDAVLAQVRAEQPPKTTGSALATA